MHTRTDTLTHISFSTSERKHQVGTQAKKICTSSTRKRAVHAEAEGLRRWKAPERLFLTETAKKNHGGGGPRETLNVRRQRNWIW